MHLMIRKGKLQNSTFTGSIKIMIRASFIAMHVEYGTVQYSTIWDISQVHINLIHTLGMICSFDQ